MSSERANAPRPRRWFLSRAAAGAGALLGAAGCARVSILGMSATSVDSVAAASNVAAALQPSVTAPEIDNPADATPEAPPAVPTAPPPPPPVPVYYSPEYVMAGYRYETTRKARWVADSLEREPLPGLEIIAPQPLTEPEVSAVHDPGYVAAVRTGQPRQLAQSQGFQWDPGLWTAVLSSNGGAIAAALAAMRGAAEGGARVAGSLSSGLHHAHRSYGLGNCTFNGLALAAKAALAAGAKNVLILDLDAHCGGGTHELVGGIPGVWQVDVAVYPFDVYTPAPRHTFDLVTQARNYLPTITRRLEQLPSRAPAFDLCLFNAGMDPYERCSLGGMPGIDQAMLADREQMVFDWARLQQVPMAFVLAGGYLGPGLDQQGLTNLHRLTLAAAASSIA